MNCGNWRKVGAKSSPLKIRKTFADFSSPSDFRKGFAEIST
jgi:hypothetical protein